MVRLTNKYTLIKQATSFFKALNQPYEVWLDYQQSKGYVFVKTGYVYKADQPTVMCILTRPMKAYEWCNIAMSLSSQGFKPVLLNSSELI